MDKLYKQVDELIIWAAGVAEKAEHNVTTTGVLAAVVSKVENGSSVDEAKKNIVEVYTNESKNSGYRV